MQNYNLCETNAFTDEGYGFSINAHHSLNLSNVTFTS